jgi:hypothetical protein
MYSIDIIVAIKQRLAEKQRPTLRQTERLIAEIERLIDAERQARQDAQKAYEYEARLNDIIPMWNGLVHVLKDVAGIEVVGIGVNPDRWQARIDGKPAGPTFTSLNEAYTWAIAERLMIAEKGFTHSSTEAEREG